MIQGSDGAFYGTTFQGGDFGLGAVFRVSADGSSFSVLHSFTAKDGSHPVAAVVQGSDGRLYGTTIGGGASGDFGTVFRIATDGSSFSVLHSFDKYSYPQEPLIQGADGAFYGVTFYGGADGRGSVFKISSDGSSFATIHDFDAAHGVYPTGRLAQGPDGSFYGTLFTGGPGFANGAVFKVAADGSSSSMLHAFDGSGGNYPMGGVIRGSDGALYGTTDEGGVSGAGTVFRLSADGSSFSVLHSFAFSDGWAPDSGLLQGSDGALYGTARAGGASQGGTVFRVSLDGSSFTTLHAFDLLNAAYPYAGLTQGTDGALYGTTAGSTFGQWASARDTVFRLTTDGASFSILTRLGSVGGSYPEAALIQGLDGAFYGTTWGGGEVGDFGTVFTVSADGSSYSVLHSFDGSQGAHPYASLVQGTDGALYGTTAEGGASPYGLGIVFKINPDGSSFTDLHDFGGPDGAFPYATLVQGVDGALYGTTAGGGARFYGTVFKLNPDGSAFQVLHDFDFAHGAYPYAGVIQGSDGNLYGTTGGDNKGKASTVFKLAADGSNFAVLRKLSRPLGRLPQASLRQGSDGNLYGTTFRGGAFDKGALFKMSADGSTFSVLHSFNTADGIYPLGALLEGYGRCSVRHDLSRRHLPLLRHCLPDGHRRVRLLRAPQLRLHGRRLSRGGSSPGLGRCALRHRGSGGPLSAGVVFRVSPGPTAFSQSVAATMGSSTPITLTAYSLRDDVAAYLWGRDRAMAHSPEPLPTSSTPRLRTSPARTASPSRPRTATAGTPTWPRSRSRWSGESSSARRYSRPRSPGASCSSA